MSYVVYMYRLTSVTYQLSIKISSGSGFKPVVFQLMNWIGTNNQPLPKTETTIEGLETLSYFLNPAHACSTLQAGCSLDM